MNVKYAKEIITLLLLEKKMSMTQLAKELTQKRNKKVYQQTLSLKLINGTLKYNEMVEICEILGYEISFNKIQ